MRHCPQLRRKPFSIFMEIIQYIFIFSFLIWLFLTIRVIFFHTITLRKWNSVEGVILDSEIIWFRSKTDSDTEGWKETVKYKYIVNAIEYENNCLTKNFGFLTPSKIFASEYSYKKYEKVVVIYKPLCPQNSVLVTKIYWLPIIAGAIFFSIIFMFLFKINVA